ncbi:ArsR/SmtB family transcription factor [Pontiella agarivorans]|uniref:Metalloregulator ArsR/SmtB family transcription factor n=1 Tax=Pontiella agarivorans TaxID=3038953 RepID=A0ABU5MYN7_9BACT|nr:metalloregulator ArsR/SmtB family transcription factor [Pontiella agarivorans]MDZ8119206.1 metalloregulator ArsR/SmtB family transcription factor [Pontiella agarivorans]
MTAEERNMAAEVLKAMAHPIRLGVIEVLAEGERTVTELYEELGCSQSMMSQQLKILCQQKLITIRKDGIQKYCSLCNRDFLRVFTCMHTHLRKYLNFRD